MGVRRKREELLMKLNEIEAILKAWKVQHDAVEKVYGHLHKLTGAMPGCMLLAPV